MSSTVILVGSQWGDEGKGKWIDYLGKNCDIICRFQGGNNAGHTIYVQGQKIVLHQLPSAPFYDHTVLLLGANVVVNPGQLISEIERVRPFTSITPDRLWISERSHVITPWHVFLDEQREASLSSPVGTTKRGIGPTYSDKMARSGLMMNSFLDSQRLQQWIKQKSEEDPRFTSFYQSHPDLWEAFMASAATLAPFVCQAETKLRQALARGKKALLEGAQGTLLDICHGTYPYVTSSSTIAGGALASLGLSPHAVDKVYGVAKAYITRVGAGPFPTELHDETGSAIGSKGQEFGATTGRARRCGWYDAVAMRYAVDVNGLDGIFINKMDVLTGFETLKIAVAYRHPSLGVLEDFPSDIDVLNECTPIYESFPGWKSDLPTTGTKASFPPAARDYLAKLSEFSRTQICAVGTGPQRHEFVL